MAAPSNNPLKFREAEEETVEEIDEGFDDFTLASSWERFISDIEAACRQWMIDGPKNLLAKGAEQLNPWKHLYKIKSEVKYGTKTYCMEYYFEFSSHGKIGDWLKDSHNLQIFFGVKDFVVIAPVSISGVILDAPEASKLLSSVAVALSNCGGVWPAFVPVHDPSRKAYIGIQNLGMSFTRRFEADRVGSQVPIRLMHLEGLYELFVSKFALYVADISTRTFNVNFSMKLTYRTPPYDDGDDIEDVISTEENTNNEAYLKAQWDDDCPWSEWYSAEDPLKGFELVTIWSEKMVQSSYEMTEIENAPSLDAENWQLFPVLLPNLYDSVLNPVGFASRLQNLVSAFDISFGAKFIEDYVSAENPGFDNLKSLNAIPPPTVLDRVLKELFHDGVQISNNQKREHSNSHAIKGAPLNSLFGQFCLNALWFGSCNIHAIAALWIEFVREIRWYWEESEPLPGMLADGVIDLSTCIIHQKLQMLSNCIKKGQGRDHSKSTENEECTFETKEESQDNSKHLKRPSYAGKQIKNNISHSASKENAYTQDENMFGPSNPEQSDCVRKGSSGVVESIMLLHSNQMMHAPYTQEAPLMTEDMHEERLHTIEAFGDSFSFSAILERNILSSDMSAFKAANPDSVFEDFIRWHSPGDWESDEIDDKGKSIEKRVEQSKCKWPPHGRLSKRMSEQGNSWRQIWNDSDSLPADQQKPLIDPVREGEKVLHYLETLSPHLLLGQIICTAFRASLGVLNHTSFGNLKHMKTKIGQLYQTIALSLRILKGNNLSDKEELTVDLKRLCVVFGHIERLLIFAASIHRKLLDIPRLSEAIFNDYFNYYLPKMGTSFESICYDKEFFSKQKVKLKEKEAVARLFPPPTANQSWRKVLSMGNLLNGHEPLLREIIFSVSDKVGNGSRYGSNSPESHIETETHRMYICGTSNDLQVGLSVISWD